MTDNKTPDDATGDSVILARVHTFLASLLVFLGFGHTTDATVVGMLDELSQWLDMAKAIRRDPQGATARIWWDAFKFALYEPSRTGTVNAAKLADDAAAEFGKRFLPVADDGRDTFDTADFEALRIECDRLDANIALLESKAEDLQHNLNTMVAERAALLKTNAHHASEIETLRQERDKLKAFRSADLLEMANLANALDAVRAVILAPTLADGDVAPAISQIVDERNKLHIAICNALGKSPLAEFDRVAAVTTLAKECDELKAQLASAIVPLPKPKRVECGQRWVIAMTANKQTDNKFATFIDGAGCGYTAFPEDLACSFYLGTDKV